MVDTPGSGPGAARHVSSSLILGIPFLYSKRPPMKFKFTPFHSFITMVALVAASNYLVQFAINNWLTWGAFLYPFTFLVNELTNRFWGPQKARNVVYAGFFTACFISIYLASWRIAMASSTAFLVSQLLDISIFSSLRQKSWWYAPFFSCLLASFVDVALFWTLICYGNEMPVFHLIAGEMILRLLLDLVSLTPFRLAMRNQKAWRSAS